MKSYSCRRILPSICVLIILLFSLSSCSSSSQAAISSAVEEASGIPTSSFLFSDATWDTTSDELEGLENKSISTTSFLGHGDKSYAFNDVF